MNTSKKIVPSKTLALRLARLRRRGTRVVFTNGCFDLLHAGHVSLLERARGLGGCLVVGLNTDASVRRLKGPGRPVNSQADRARVLAALACVDFVTLFPEDTPWSLIRLLKPDVLVKGGDYRRSQIVGADLVRRVVRLPLLPGRSTTRLLKICAG